MDRQRPWSSIKPPKVVSDPIDLDLLLIKPRSWDQIFEISFWVEQGRVWDSRLIVLVNSDNGDDSNQSRGEERWQTQRWRGRLTVEMRRHRARGREGGEGSSGKRKSKKRKSKAKLLVVDKGKATSCFFFYFFLVFFSYLHCLILVSSWSFTSNVANLFIFLPNVIALSKVNKHWVKGFCLDVKSFPQKSSECNTILHFETPHKVLDQGKNKLAKYITKDFLTITWA